MAKLNILTLGSSKNYTDLAAFGLTNGAVNDTDKTISFTLVADGSTRILHFDPPSDGQDGVSVTGLSDKGNGVFTLLLSDGSETEEIHTLQGVKGDKGNPGQKGEKGEPGNPGYTPVKGTDYWTSEDISEIQSYIDTQIGGALNGSY